MCENFAVETLTQGTKVYVNNSHRVGSDALLLSRFCNSQGINSIAELGSGCGIVLFDLYDRGFRGQMSAVEIEAEACELIEKSKAENNIQNLNIINKDLREYKSSLLFDAVIANPPYFAGGPLSPQHQRAAARHLIFGGINDWCKKAAALLKSKGSFYVCSPPSALAPLFAALLESKLCPKHMQLVRHSVQQPPWLCLIEATKSKNAANFNPHGLTFMPDNILEQCNY